MFPCQLIDRMWKSLDTNRGLSVLPGASMTISEVGADLAKYKDRKAAMHLSYIVDTVYFINKAVPTDIKYEYNCIFIYYKNYITLVHYTKGRNKTRYALYNAINNSTNFEINNVEEAEQVGRFISMVLEASDAKN